MNLPLKITFKHIKGHQDSGQITVLPQEAWMNIKMDAVAKQKVIVTGLKHQQHEMPYEGWVCVIKGQ